MYSFKDYISLQETYKNPGFNPDHEKYREQYRPQIHHILRQVYKDKGGYGGTGHGTEAEDKKIHADISNSALKINTHHGTVKAVHLYTKKHGRKLVAGGTDQTKDGVKRYINTAKADFGTRAHERNTWIEAPDHDDPEHPARTKGVGGAIRRFGVKKIPRETMKKMLPDKELHDREGPYGYSRVIGTEKDENGKERPKQVKKIGLGNPKIS